MRWLRYWPVLVVALIAWWVVAEAVDSWGEPSLRDRPACIEMEMAEVDAMEQGGISDEVIQEWLDNHSCPGDE